MATMKFLYNGSWVVVTDPDAERRIYKQEEEPSTAVEGSLWITTEDATEGVVNSTGITAYVSLPVSNWSSADPYYQNIELAGTTATSKIDLMPDISILNIITSSNHQLCIANDGEILTCYCYGNKPTQDLIIPVVISEVINDENVNALIVGNTIGSAISWGTWGVDSEAETTGEEEEV